MSKSFSVGDWVVDKNGNVCMVVKHNRTGSYLVKYGEKGTFKTYKKDLLTAATEEQIAAVTFSDMTSDFRCVEDELNDLDEVMKKLME